MHKYFVKMHISSQNMDYLDSMSAKGSRSMFSSIHGTGGLLNREVVSEGKPKKALSRRRAPSTLWQWLLIVGICGRHDGLKAQASPLGSENLNMKRNPGGMVFPYLNARCSARLAVLRTSRKWKRRHQKTVIIGCGTAARSLPVRWHAQAHLTFIRALRKSAVRRLISSIR